MSHPELLLLNVLRALLQIALMFLIGQGLLALLAGSRRHTNIVYRLFILLTSPVVNAVRKITPKKIIDKHVPLVAFFLLFWMLWGVTNLKRAYCETHLLQCF
jgi:uncharacterized protein YggT (Ycf19 family)